MKTMKAFCAAFAAAFLINTASASGPTAKAVRSYGQTTLTFVFDEKDYGTEGVSWFDAEAVGDFPTWYSISSDITKVVIDSSFAKFSPMTCKNWFRNFTKLQTIVNLKYLNTTYVTDMSYMFCDCKALQSLDLSGFNTANATTMLYMFSGCWKVPSLDVSRFDTSSVTGMGSMFKDCRSIRSLDLSTFDVSHVTSMSAMFSGCEKLQSVDLSDWDTSSVVQMQDMFYRCEELKTLDIWSFDTSHVQYMQEMFYRCYTLTRIYASIDFVTTAVTTGFNVFGMNYMLVGDDGSRPGEGEDGYDYTYAKVTAGGFLTQGPAPRGMATVGDYGKWLLAKDLKVAWAVSAEAAKKAYTVAITGLPPGLVLKSNRQKTQWWIEGVPKKEVDWKTMPIYATVVVNKKARVEKLSLSVHPGYIKVDPALYDIGTLYESELLYGCDQFGSGYTVSGLPPGFAVMNNRMTGTPMVPGDYIVTVAKKVNGYTAFYRSKVSVAYPAIDPVKFPNLEDHRDDYVGNSVVWSLKNVGKMKSVTGLPTGLVFDAKKQVIKGTLTRLGEFCVTFEKDVGIPNQNWKTATRAYVKWRVLDAYGPLELGFNTDGTASKAAMQGVTYGASGGQVFNTFTVSSGAKVSAAGLPKGISLVKVDATHWGFKGTTVKAGTYVVTVAAAYPGKAVTQRMAIEVGANPTPGVYRGFAEIGGKIGAVTVVVAASGASTLTYVDRGVRYTAKSTRVDLIEQDAYDPRMARYRVAYNLPADKARKRPLRSLSFLLDSGPSGSLTLVYPASWSFVRKDVSPAVPYADNVRLGRCLSAAEVKRLAAEGVIDPIQPISTYLVPGDGDYDPCDVATAKWNAKTGAFTVAGRSSRGKAFSCSTSVMSVLDVFGGIINGWHAFNDADGSPNYLCFNRDAFYDGYDAGNLPSSSLEVIYDGATTFKILYSYKDNGTPVNASMKMRVKYQKATKKTSAVNYVAVSFDDGASWKWVKASWALGRLRFTIPIVSLPGHDFTIDALYDQCREGFEGWGQISHAGKKKVSGKWTNVNVVDNLGNVVLYPLD